MARPPSEHPTELELEILKVLWDEAPLAVRDVRERLDATCGRALSHSSVITMLNIMVRKGYLRRKKDGKAFLFTPQEAKQEITGNIVGDVVSRVFDGSSSAMMLSLIETGEVDADELAEIRKLINRKVKEQKQ